MHDGGQWTLIFALGALVAVWQRVELVALILGVCALAVIGWRLLDVVSSGGAFYDVHPGAGLLLAGLGAAGVVAGASMALASD